MKNQYEKFVLAAMQTFVFSDMPKDFENTQMVKVFVELIEMEDEVFSGNTSSVLDWILDE
jgi:hypothetical protein